MSKNNKKTINVRTHNSFGVYKSPNHNPDEEIATDFEDKPRKVATDKNQDQQSNKNK